MSQRPLVWFTVCWVLGSSAAASLPSLGIAAAGAALLALLASQVLLRRCSWTLAAACMAAFGLAAGQRTWTDARNVTALPEPYAAALAASPADGAAYEAKLAGKIVSPPEIDGDRVQFRVAGSSIAVSGEGAPVPVKLGGERLLVQVKLAKEEELQAAAAWKRGQQVIVTGALTVPASGTNFGGFDYRAYLRGQRIHWLLGADGAAAVHASAGPRWSVASLLQRMDAVRAALGRRMDALYPGVQAGYMKGLVLGISDDLDPAMFRQFSQLGLTHILAISGLHVAVFLYALGGLLRMLRMTRERMLLVMIAAVPLYVLLAGASPSVVRSGIMAMLGLAAARLHKLKDGLHLLAAAALLMLLWEPYMLGNVGFQLSFLVTAGLIMGTSSFRKLLPRGGKWWTTSMYDLLSVTVVAQAVSLPLTIYYFNGLHVLSIAANLVLVPFISFVVMPLGGASLLLEGLWHPAGVLVAQMTVLGNELTFGFIMKLSSWKSFRLIWATPPLWWVAAFYGALGVVFYTLGKLQAAKEDSAAAEGETSREVSSIADEPTQPLQLPRANQSRVEPRNAGKDAETAVWSAPFIELPTVSPAAQRKHHFALAGAVSALAALLVGAYYPDAFDRNAYVDFLDVGQGDSIYIRTAGGKHMLIDGGGAVSFGNYEAWRQRKDPFEVGRKVVVPLLQQRGVHQIDLLVLSHLDSDHIKGLLAVMDAIPVRAILWNGTVKASEDAVSLLRSAVDADIPMYRAASGLNWRIDSGASIQVIGSPPSLLDAESFRSVVDAKAPSSASEELASSPPTTGVPDAAIPAVPDVEDQNGESTALLINLYGRQFLFTGDADAEEERSLLTQLHAGEERSPEQSSSSKTPAAETPKTPTTPKTPATTKKQQPIDVMKISHHGSKSSSTDEWLAFWQPSEAVISVGRNNMYGHPHPDVLERLRQAGIEAARTDLDGEVQFRINPGGVLQQRHDVPAR
ncbi:DUF4131 domain-containing protein [Paenibacillus rhizovicinus]|uniref:DUF4131 domain-containing protein n=1 Tax=Paenibacillus rhizovicinus TaxID=2704463 RepID=A0A6C0NWE5_9BACL|nr:ComEC/Rec2 family competence protein [Paenibacillus rhizovicinus]QHW30478.1 DUF4131 domain-containing protein [Paenibacillus rhizovicinus]